MLSLPSQIQKKGGAGFQWRSFEGSRRAKANDLFKEGHRGRHGFTIKKM